MTREGEEARLAEIEALPNVTPRFKATFREHMERRWMLQEAGIEDLGEYRLRHRTLKDT